MELKDTIELMNNADYKERYKGEYYQVKIRSEKLEAMLEKYKAGKLNFTPSCSLPGLQHWLYEGLFRVLHPAADSVLRRGWLHG